MAKLSRETESADSATDWQKIISETLQWRQQIESQERWMEFIDEYKNKWDHITSRVKIPILPLNLVYAYVKTEIARLYFQDPYIAVNPKRPQDIGAAAISEQLINYYWKELELKREIKRAQIDAHLVGHAWMKIGYTADFSPAEYDVQKGKEVELNEFITNENIFAYRVSWKDVLFSPDSLNPPYDSRWIAHRIVRPYSAIVNSNLYKNTNTLKPLFNPSTLDNPTLKNFTQVAVLWEIWYRDSRRVYTIAEGSDKFLRIIDWPYTYLEGYPFIMFKFNENPDEPYPLSDVGMQEPLIVELMKLMAIMTNHLKRWNRQIFMRTGFLTEQEQEKFRSGIDGAIIQTEDAPANGIFIPPYAPVQSDIYGIWNLIMDMWRNITGQSEVERGAAARTQTRTLGELRLTLTGGRARADEKVDMLEDSMEEMARKLLQIMKQTLSVPKMIRIIGATPENLMAILQSRPSAGQAGALTGEKTFTLTKEDIQGEFDVDVVAGSTVPLSRENRLKLLEQILTSLPSIGIPPGGQASRSLGREILRDIGIKSAENIFKEAEQEQLQAQALQQAQAQAPNLGVVSPEGQGRALQEELALQAGQGL